MAATKTQKQTAKPAAKKGSSKPAPVQKASRKPVAVQEVAETKNQQGRRIQETMSAAPMTIEQIAAKTGLSVARVTEHVNWEISKGRSKLDTKKRVQVISQPQYRNQG